MKKAIVTGANGFVGSAVCNELINRGVHVVAVVKDMTSDLRSIRFLDDIQIVYCDMDNYERLPEMIADRDVDVFFHFAWDGSAGVKRTDTDLQIENIKSSCNAVKVCQLLNCKRFVFSGSIMEYEVNALMNTERTANLNSVYATAKLASDYMVRAISCDIGVEFIRAVISNVYGPGESNSRLINSSIRKMMNRERCSFSAGRQMYDFIYIDDAAKAFCEIGEKGISNKTYYIGSEKPRKLVEYLQELNELVDPDVEIGIGELPYNGPSLTYKEFDINAVKNDTGFVPTVSFKDGILRTKEWILENNK